ncbi:MAG: DUF503 domain-containing protein [Deltaproteobacteria bacterium]|nr:DUF503 domain-containing protein [Deltaproteobacteria bacterium]
MVVGTGLIDFRIGACHSLKEKRGVLSRIIKRTQNTFNISIAEVGANDDLKKAKVGFSVVGNDAAYINAKIDHIMTFIDNLQMAEMVNTKFEITHFSDWMDPVDYVESKYDAV